MCCSWGGQGANTGVQDVHNLAWKLAAVLKGQAAPDLLTTYDVERQPVGRAATEDSASRAGEQGILSIKPINPTLLSILSSKLIQKVMGKVIWQKTAHLLGYGYRYRSAAIIADQRKGQPGQLNGEPGTRAPHAWVEHRGRRVSTLDLFGTSFVLLAGSDGMAWCNAARLIAERRGLNLIAYSVGPQGDLLDPELRWQEKAGLNSSSALLVRPDGFVAWRASAQNDNCEQQLERVLDQLLGVSARARV